MQELDYELWKYGVPSKTKHNETAPSQHEVACIYRNVNITTDNNNLLMQLAQDIAHNHGLRCLLHEKPYEGINGSGKHNNWSVITNTGINLFKPGSDPINNILSWTSATSARFCVRAKWRRPTCPSPPFRATSNWQS